MINAKLGIVKAFKLIYNTYGGQATAGKFRSTLIISTIIAAYRGFFRRQLNKSRWSCGGQATAGKFRSTLIISVIIAAPRAFSGGS